MQKKPAGKPLVVPSETDLAWAAGIIDGEGCIMVCYNGSSSARDARYYQVRLVVTNTNAPLIRRLRMFFGGSIAKCKKAKASYRQKAQWSLTGTLCVEGLRQVLPYLVSKAPEAELAIQVGDTILRRGNYKHVNGWFEYEAISKKRAEIRADIQRLKRTEYSYEDFVKEAF